MASATRFVAQLSELKQLEELALEHFLFPAGSVKKLSQSLVCLRRLVLSFARGDGLLELGCSWPSLRCLQLRAPPSIDLQVTIYAVKLEFV